MNKELLRVRMTFTEPLLGSASGNKELADDFIIAKAPTTGAMEEERADLPKVDVEESIQKASTIFSADEVGMHLWDYQIRGFIKESIRVLIELGDIKTLSKYLHKKAVDSFVMIHPRKIYLLKPDGSPYKRATGTLQRPIRAETLQGERIALARSEMLPAGTRIEYDVWLLTGTNTKSRLACLTMEDIKAALDYAQWKGLGQWRSGSFGRANWEERKMTEK